MIQFVRIDAWKHQQLAGVCPNVCAGVLTHQLYFEGDPGLPPEGLGHEHQRRWNQPTPPSSTSGADNHTLRILVEKRLFCTNRTDLWALPFVLELTK